MNHAAGRTQDPPRRTSLTTHFFDYKTIMKVYNEILGNMKRDQRWATLLQTADVDFVPLDQWTAQKSRFLAKGVSGVEYPVALRRHTQVADGDIIDYNASENRAVVLKIELNPVMVVDLEGIASSDHDTIIRVALELGHAIGNQHWPAVVKGTKVYVPLTVDKKVMMSVMETHHIEGITFGFENGFDVIPYLLPHEIRRLFGGAGHESHSHSHDHGHIVHYDHDSQDCTHHHTHEECHHHHHDNGSDCECECDCESQSIH